MKIVAIFNNKGGVGKSTLCFHLGHALSEMGKKVLLIDLDPQCNLTICGIRENELEKIWEDEEKFIDDYGEIKNTDVEDVLNHFHSIHFLLKATEEGVDELETYPKPINLGDNLDLIPGRLSIHKFENKIAERWSSIYQGDNLAIRTITNIRRICERYNETNKYDYILIDTSPSLGILNKIIISTVDGFFIPTQPDMFSLYGIKNIGKSLSLWRKEFDMLTKILPNNKTEKFPKKSVQFIGFTLYNAKKKDSGNNKYKLAQAHYTYALKIPETIKEFISKDNIPSSIKDISEPIGGVSIIHTHNTFPSISQLLKCPMWKIPEEYNNIKNNVSNLKELFPDDVNITNTINGQNVTMRGTKDKYVEFANDFIRRTEYL